MASYTRLGSHLLANELATDPFGKIHRGLSIAGGKFEKHVLIKTFCEELLESGIGQKLTEASANLSQFAGMRGFGANYELEAGRTPALICDYIPGRSLAQVLEKTKHEQIPLGVDHALSVLQSLGQAVVQMHSKGASHGVLSPHSIWVSFEGATHVLDAPIVTAIRGVLPKARITSMSLERYRRNAPTPLQQDFLSLGAIFYELLTLEKLPTTDLLPTALAKATLKAAQDDAPIPPEIMGLLKRLLGLEQPYENAGAYNAEMERVLYDGDYSPTTFNMAFFMHTLFREENDQDLQAMKADQTADFTPFLDMDTTSRGGALDESQRRSYGTYAFVGGSVLALVLGFLGYTAWSNSQKYNKAMEELAKVQQEYAVNDQKLKDIANQEDTAKRQKEELTRKLEKGTAQEKADAKKKLEALQKEEKRLAADKAAVLQKQEELKQRTDTVKQAVSTGKPVDAAKLPEPVKMPPPAPKYEEQPRPSAPIPETRPAPAPQPAPAAAQPTPAQVPAVQPAPSAGRDTDVQIATAAAARYPIMARMKKFEQDKDHRVTVKVFVDPTGRPLRASIVEGVAGNFGFDEEATNAIMASTFKPATKNGRPVPGWFTKTFLFPKSR